MLVEILFFLFYCVAVGAATLVMAATAANRYGPHVTKDPVTWAVCCILSTTFIVGGAQALAWVTGHLSGRL